MSAEDLSHEVKERLAQFKANPRFVDQTALDQAEDPLMPLYNTPSELRGIFSQIDKQLHPHRKQPSGRLSQSIQRKLTQIKEAYTTLPTLDLPEHPENTPIYNDHEVSSDTKHVIQSIQTYLDFQRELENRQRLSKHLQPLSDNSTTAVIEDDEERNALKMKKKRKDEAIKQQLLQTKETFLIKAKSTPTTPQEERARLVEDIPDEKERNAVVFLRHLYQKGTFTPAPSLPPQKLAETADVVQKYLTSQHEAIRQYSNEVQTESYSPTEFRERFTPELDAQIESLFGHMRDFTVQQLFPDGKPAFPIPEPAQKGKNKRSAKPLNPHADWIRLLQPSTEATGNTSLKVRKSNKLEVHFEDVKGIKSQFLANHIFPFIFTREVPLNDKVVEYTFCEISWSRSIMIHTALMLKDTSHAFQQQTFNISMAMGKADKGAVDALPDIINSFTEFAQSAVTNNIQAHSPAHQ